MSLIDHRLARLCEAWRLLPEHVILAILAVVDDPESEMQIGWSDLRPRSG
jgi:hypothetical protein